MKTGAAVNSVLPATAAKLTALSLDFQRRPGTKDLILKCICGATLICDEERPFHYCMGKASCRVNRMEFGALLLRLR